MKSFRIDASIVCFAIVVLAAIPVTTLRSKTYAVGYELGHLKETERALRQRNIELQSTLASAQRAVRDKLLARSSKSDTPPRLALPSAEAVIRAPQETQAQKAARKASATNGSAN